MWQNYLLKKDAKFHLRGSFSIGLLLLLIVAVITFSINRLVGILSGFSIYDELMHFYNEMNNYQYLDDEEIIVRGFVFFSKFLRYSIILGGITFILDILLLQPFDISVKNWFVRNREVANAPGLDMTFKHFGANYKDLFLGNLWKQLWLFIWSLPSIVTGIAATLITIDFGNQAINNNGVIEITVLHASILSVATIVSFINAFFIINRKLAYLMQPYVLADNPKFGYRKSLNLSKKMMKNNKWHTIGLGLSFIGWVILAALLASITLGLSVVILSVYTSQTFAELYGAIRYTAVNRGDVSLEELGFVKQDSEEFNESYSNFAGNERQSENLNPYDPDWKNPYANSGSERAPQVRPSESDRQELDNDIDNSNYDEN